MRRIQRGELHPGVIQGEEIAVRPGWQPVRRLVRRGRLQAAWAEHAAIGHAEQHRPVARRLDRRAISHARRERRLEAQHRDEPPHRPQGGGIHAVGDRSLEDIERGSERIVSHRERRRGRHLEHPLGERRGASEPPDVVGQVAPQVHEVEGAEGVQLARLAEVELGHALAQELEPRSEPALRPQRTLGDGALHPQVPRREPHDLGRLAVAVRLEHHGGGSDERHGYCVAATPAAPWKIPTRTRWGSRGCGGPRRTTTPPRPVEPPVAPALPAAPTYSQLSPPTTAKRAPKPVSGIESGVLTPQHSNDVSQLSPAGIPPTRLLLTTNTRLPTNTTARGKTPAATLVVSPVKRSKEHTSELQSPCNLVCRLLLEKKKKKIELVRNATI